MILKTSFCTLFDIKLFHYITLFLITHNFIFSIIYSSTDADLDPGTGWTYLKLTVEDFDEEIHQQNVRHIDDMLGKLQQEITNYKQLKVQGEQIAQRWR